MLEWLYDWMNLEWQLNILPPGRVLWPGMYFHQISEPHASSWRCVSTFSHQLRLEGNCSLHNLKFEKVPKVSPFHTLISALCVGLALMGLSHGDHSSAVTAQLIFLHRFPSPQIPVSCGAAGSALSKGKLYGELFAEKSTPVLRGELLERCWRKERFPLPLSSVPLILLCHWNVYL